MKRCIACGAPLWETPLLTLDNMPASAQHMPGADSVDKDQGLTLDLCQCTGCGLVQFDCEPVDYYRDVIRAGGFSKTMVELRRYQYRHLIDTYGLEGKRFIEVGCGQGEFLKVLSEFPVEVFGIEHDAKLVEAARAQGLAVSQGFTESEDTVFPGGLYDVFLSFNFLEHQPNPNTMLHAIYRNLEDDGMGVKEVTIDAICENYMGHYLYLSPDYYRELFGKEAASNGVLFKMKEGQTDQIEAVGGRLLGDSNVLNVSYTSSIEDRLDDMLQSLNLVIVVLIISAGMLAFIVLYNLNTINITERKRELATIKVLGFYDTEVAAYVYRENVLLTLIGAVAGMALGWVLLQFVIVTVEVDDVMFGRVLDLTSYLYSFLFTLGFSMFVNWVMYFKLKKIDMVESLKSVE